MRRPFHRPRPHETDKPTLLDLALESPLLGSRFALMAKTPRSTRSLIVWLAKMILSTVSLPFLTYLRLYTRYTVWRIRLVAQVVAQWWRMECAAGSTPGRIVFQTSVVVALAVALTVGLYFTLYHYRDPLAIVSDTVLIALGQDPVGTALQPVED